MVKKTLNLIKQRFYCKNPRRKIEAVVSIQKRVSINFGQATVLLKLKPEYLLQSPDLTYFKKAYLDLQNHDNLTIFEDDDYFIPIATKNDLAISVPRSPFGSFFIKNRENTFEFEKFEALLLNRLPQVKQLEIRHPSSLYSNFISKERFQQNGYRLLFHDINQHIELTSDWEGEIHEMQKRKLRSLKENGFEFRVIPPEDVKKVHQFISVCRQTQGLEINISLELLQNLTNKLPDQYTFFGVFRGEKMSAVCVAVNVTNKVAYYYLPATSPMFRSESPMVLLIAGMVEHYQKAGYQSLDLGVSSFQGKPQETLRLFKARMGAIETKKPTFLKHF
ncbi:MAG: hypothetical protein Tsb0034_26230 [Ekhidna sp.]